MLYSKVCSKVASLKRALNQPIKLSIFKGTNEEVKGVSLHEKLLQIFE